MELTSRIHKFIPRDLMFKLNKICRDRTISDNNKKADMFTAALKEYRVPFRELGPGTNRFAVMIDGYVFKIAMDKNGVNDNFIEFSMSAELQPYVSKTYECNGLIVVSEYVTVISKEEFRASEEAIKGILAILSSEYLLGDVGFVLKNYLNWGYREDGSLVILDYGFIYRVTGEEVRCDRVKKDDTVCGSFLEYDSEYNMLVCPKCRAKYNFADIRRKMNLDYEKNEIERSKEECYMMTSEKMVVDDNGLIVAHSQFEPENEINEGSEDTVSKYNESERYYTDDELMAMYNAEIDNYGKHTHESRYVEPVVPEEPCNECEHCNEYIDDSDYSQDEFYDTPGYGSHFYTNEDEIYDNPTDLTFTLANVNGKMALFTPSRLHESEIPDGLFRYEIRETDDYEGIVCEIGKKIIINFYGSVLLTEPIGDLETCHTLFLDYSSDFKLTTKDMTIEEFINSVDMLDNVEHRICEQIASSNTTFIEPDVPSEADTVVSLTSDDDDDEFMADPEEDDERFDDDEDEDDEDIEDDTSEAEEDEDFDKVELTSEDTSVTADVADTDDVDILESARKMLSEEGEVDEEEDEEEFDDDEDEDIEDMIEDAVIEAIEEAAPKISSNVANDIREQLKNQIAADEGETQSYTSWSEPDPEAISRLLEEEEEHERRGKQNKSYKRSKNHY